MIKIAKAVPAGTQHVRLEFSDGTHGVFDFSDILKKDSSLTRPLRSEVEFSRFFLELGALCWPNGLEFSAHYLRQELEKAGRLQRKDVA